MASALLLFLLLLNKINPILKNEVEGSALDAECVVTRTHLTSTLPSLLSFFLPTNMNESP